MKISYLLLLLFMISCKEMTEYEEQPEYIQGNSKRWSTPKGKEIRYFKDTRTNLCFAERGTDQDYSFACVPCDSIKNLNEEDPY